MRVPLSWLKDFVPLTQGVDEIADTFNSLGLVVEGIERVGEGLDGVVIGHVLDVRTHPNADKVRLADVDLGGDEPVQIACGAANLAPGQLVPVATIGTTLPNGMTIERRKLRGEWSNGMICAEDEIGLAKERSGGIMVLPEGLSIGSPFADSMGIERDVVFDLEIETNRPDAMCIAGIARDIAGKLGLPFTLPQPDIDEAGPKVDELATVVVEDTELCPRFTGRVITGVRVTQSPDRIRRRLTLAGMRPINNIVDASNYVMLELGQPSHPFDLDRLPGRGLRIRKTRDNETIETLDGSERSLPGGAGAVCDAEGNVVAVAGIMGGASSEIVESTTTVLNEAAVWNPYAINLTSRLLALRTDASARFERRVDREGVQRAQDRFCEILLQSCPDAVVATGTIDHNTLPSWPSDAERVRVRTSRVNAVLGTDLDDEAVQSLIRPIGFQATPVEPGVAEVLIPSFRPDSDREIDVIEEIARMYGYDNIPRRVPTAPTAARLTPYQLGRRKLRSLLIGRGFTEAWTAALLGPEDVEKSGVDAEPIALTNPVVREESLLRPSLLPGMLRAIAFNVARQQHELYLFEIGHVFNQPTEGSVLPDERERLAIAIATPSTDGREIATLARDLAWTMNLVDASFAPTTAPGLHPTRATAINGRSGVIGVLGEVDPEVLRRFGIDNRVAWLEVDAEAVIDHVVAVPQMRPVSKYPSAEFDLAFVVPNDVVADDVWRTLLQSVGPNAESVTLFDVFRGGNLDAGTRSLAYRLRITAFDHTLTEAETGDIRRRAIEAVEQAHGATLRA